MVAESCDTWSKLVARGPQVDVRGQGHDEAGAWWGEGTAVDVRGQGHEAGAWWGEGTTG